jgi:hypothetical protein
MAIIPATPEAGVGRSRPKAGPYLEKRNKSKNPAKLKELGGMAQVIELLPSKCKDLSSTPSTTHTHKVIE